MLVTSIVLCIGLISSTCPTVTAISFSVPDTVTIGQSFTVTWTAGPFDPDKFTLVTRKQNLSDLNKWDEIDLTGQPTGFTNLSLFDTGTYYVAALFDSLLPVGISKGIRVNAQDSSAPVSSSSSNTHQQSLLFTGTSTTAPENLKILSDSSITSSQPSQNHASPGSVTDSALVSISDSSGQVVQTSSHGLTTTNSIRASIVTTNQSPTNLPLSTMSHTRPSHVPLIIGSTLGVIVVLIMTMGFLVIRHRRSRLLRIPISPYEFSGSGDTGAQSRMPRAVLNWQKRHLQINNPAGITGNGAEIPSEKAVISPEPEPFEDAPQTERQQSLQAQAVEMERQLADSEAENIQLREEIQALHDLNHSDWALGLTDIPPPSYPHSETSSI